MDALKAPTLSNHRYYTLRNSITLWAVRSAEVAGSTDMSKLSTSKTLAVSANRRGTERRLPAILTPDALKYLNNVVLPAKHGVGCELV